MGIAAVLAVASSLHAGAQEHFKVPEPNPMDEAALIGVLQSDAGFVDKQEACRALRQKGTDASVPALAALLTDKDLSHMARYALETMMTPAAGEALRKAIGLTDGAPKAGVITSLGVRRDDEAVEAIASALASPDVDVARAAAGALGRIGTPAAVERLLAFSGEAPDRVKPAVAEGLLAAGDYMCRDGKSPEAAAIYTRLLESDWPLYVKMGAFAGRIHAEPEHAPDRLIEALGGQEAAFRDMAAELVAEPEVSGDTARYLGALSSLSASGQVALLRGLEARGDKSARDVVARLASESDGDVKRAAVKALGALGGPENVSTLAMLMSSDDRNLADAARASLVAMKEEGVNVVLAEMVTPASGALKVALLEILATRNAEQASPLAIASLIDPDPAVRTTAFRVLSSVGTKDDIDEVLAAFLKITEKEERTVAERALGDIGLRNSGDAVPPILAAFQAADVDQRVALLRILARIGGGDALAAVVAGLNDADPRISAESLNLLTNWQTLDAAPQLLELARSEEESRSILGLRGYVRLAGGRLPTGQKVEMLKAAMPLADRPEELRLLLGAWGATPSQESLAVLKPYLENAEVQTEAAVAVIAVAEDLARRADTKPIAREALNEVIGKVQDEDIKARARETLAAIQ